MRVTVPTSLEDITIRQYQEYILLCDSKPNDHDLINGLFKIFCGIDNAEDITNKDRYEIVNDINKALISKGVFDRKPFIYKHKEYAMHPNFDKLSGREFNSISEFGKLEESEYKISLFRADTMHYLMAVLFREVDNTFKDTYSVFDYLGTEEEAQFLLDLPMSKVIGIESFFLTLKQDLLTTIQKYMEEEQVREVEPLTISINGDSRQVYTT